MLGRRFEEMYPAPRSHSSTSQGLTISSLRIPGIVEDFSIFAQRGEVTCIAGQVGAGAAMIIRSLAGLIPEATGRILLDGVALPIGSVRKRVRRNVAFVSEDRGREGLFRRSVLENLAATHFPKCRRFGLLSWSKVRRFASGVCPRVMLDGNRLDADAFDLSGGNQQKILFARAFGIEQPGVILINEPTRGVDVGARAEIYRVLREFCRMGYVLLMTSSDLEEVVGISDSVITMYRGRAISRYERGQIDMSTILADITHPAGTAK
jgi:ABC-type sugar transport system ATPase subunit